MDIIKIQTEFKILKKDFYNQGVKEVLVNILKEYDSPDPVYAGRSKWSKDELKALFDLLVEEAFLRYWTKEMYPRLVSSNPRKGDLEDAFRFGMKLKSNIGVTTDITNIMALPAKELLHVECVLTEARAEEIIDRIFNQ